MAKKTIGHAATKNGEKTRFKSGKEAAEAGRKGGIASGVAKREKKTFRELAKALMDVEVTTKDGQTRTNRELVLLAQLSKAVKQKDTNSAKWLADLCGENTPDTLELTGKDGAALNPEPIQIQIIHSRNEVKNKDN